MSQPPPANVPLSDGERHTLQSFVRLVEEMLHSRFYLSLKEMDHTVEFSYSPEGEPQYQVPAYDWEDLKSFMTSFRQIAMNQKDLVYITAVRNIISRHAGQKYQDDLKALKKVVVRVLEGKVGLATMGVQTATGPVDLSGMDLLDALVNGELFHSGAEHEAVLERLQALPRGSYLWLVLGEVIMPILHASWHLVKVILWAKLLPDRCLPERLRGVDATEAQPGAAETRA